MINIRSALPQDVGAITEIYNQAILRTTATFDTEPKSAEAQQTWFAEHDSQHPVLVAEKDGVVAGWASLSRWSDRCAYSGTAEISLYIAEGERGKGIGRKLFEAILLEGQKAGLHTVIARIVEGNAASIHLYERAGFIPIGTMREVGRKFDKLLDVLLLQKIY
ncbi:MAG: GNAT family N-acetyltransferase [Dehalococcoidia bacterium]|nr:GNAT family N-acetyltransferase [Dehalococcoidia bacterium]MDD5495028.1 GNAT family N-acetyltransferase [Dehalococcoidia bacterium]